MKLILIILLLIPTTLHAGVNFGMSSSPISLTDYKFKDKKELIDYVGYLQQTNLFDILHIDHYYQLVDEGQRLKAYIPKQDFRILLEDKYITVLKNFKEADKYGKHVWKSPRAMNALRYKIKTLEEEYQRIQYEISKKRMKEGEDQKVVDEMRLYDLALSVALVERDRARDLGAVVFGSSTPL